MAEPVQALCWRRWHTAVPSSWHPQPHHSLQPHASPQPTWLYLGLPRAIPTTEPSHKLAGSGANPASPGSWGSAGNTVNYPSTRPSAVARHISPEPSTALPATIYFTPAFLHHPASPPLPQPGELLQGAGASARPGLPQVRNLLLNTPC